MKKLFGIIGDPIKHSLSPYLHNYWFEKYKINAHYSIFNVANNNFKDVIDKIKRKEIHGINVTLPFKQKIINNLDKLINDAEITGSVNTVYINNSGLLIGENTDVYGLKAAYLKEIDSASNKKALVIGAGGVSPSVILSLQKSGVKKITISNRTVEKCYFLKKKFININISKWENLKDEISKHDIVINATSLGLKGKKNFDFKPLNFKKELIYIDTIYNPLETTMLKYFKQNEVKVFNGLDMFIYQGQKSFYLWNKINPEIDQKLINLLIAKLND